VKYSPSAGRNKFFVAILSDLSILDRVFSPLPPGKLTFSWTTAVLFLFTDDRQELIFLSLFHFGGAGRLPTAAKVEREMDKIELSLESASFAPAAQQIRYLHAKKRIAGGRLCSS
jgi:hypothetical protein